MKRLTFFLLAWVSGCGLHTAPPVPTCSGGTRLVANQCVCALGTTWDGQRCEGTPQAGICGNGAAQFGATGCFCPDGTNGASGTCVALDCASQGAIVDGNNCTCPDGTAWDAGSSHCNQLNCGGGSVPSGHECVCTDGKSWQDNQCEISCINGAVHTDADHCACPAGEVVANNECEACSGGAVVSGDGSQCVCPDGTTWEDTQCMLPPGDNTAAEHYFHQFIAWTDGNGGNHWLESGLGPANASGYQPRLDITLQANGHFSCDVYEFAADGTQGTGGHVEGWWSVDSDHTVINLPGVGIGYKTWENHAPAIELHVSFASAPDLFAANTVVTAAMTR
jgi:hypothetical protein